MYIGIITKVLIFNVICMSWIASSQPYRFAALQSCYTVDADEMYLCFPASFNHQFLQ